jgi:hypothetical protein
MQRAFLRLCDLLPGALVDPLDYRLDRLLVGIESLETDWDIEEMKGLDCADSAWLGHAAFAHCLVLYLKPQVIVDLGVCSGCSTFAMALALKKLRCGRIYAVDTWEGDAHVGYYSGTVYERFMETRSALGVEEHVVPLKMLFSESKSLINEQIDLLHIDGLHTFRAATEDFRLFRKQLAPGAMVMFHDVYNESFPDMRILWKWLALRHRCHIRRHSSGLGLILERGGRRDLGLPKLLTYQGIIDSLRDRIAVNLVASEGGTSTIAQLSQSSRG